MPSTRGYLNEDIPIVSNSLRSTDQATNWFIKTSTNRLHVPVNINMHPSADVLSVNRNYSRFIRSRCAMTAVRDTLCNLRPLEIPRPHIPGLQFIPTRGRLGFYKSIRRDGAQFGLQIKPMGPRRPALADACWDPPVNASKQSNPETSSRRSNPDASKQLNEQSCGERLRNSMNSSDEESQTSSISQLSNYSDGSASTRNSPVDEPEYPEPDYDIITPPNVKTKLCADTINNLRKF